MQLVVTKSNTLNAFSWIKQGWRLFTLQPGPFMGMSALVLFATLMANMIPILGIVVVFLSPFLTAGYYRAASLAEQGESLTVTDIFALLSDISKYRVLIRLAVFSVIMSIPISLVAESIVVNFNEGMQPDPQTSLLFMMLMMVNFMLFAFAIPAAWVSPEMTALDLVKQSFRACWVNIMPLALYGVLIATISLISFPIVLVGWLIAHAVGVLSFYQMFMSIYQPKQDEGETEQQVQSESTEQAEQKKQDESQDSDQI